MYFLTPKVLSAMGISKYPFNNQSPFEFALTSGLPVSRAATESRSFVKVPKKTPRSPHLKGSLNAHSTLKHKHADLKVLCELLRGKRLCLTFFFADLKTDSYPHLGKTTKIVQLCSDPFIGNNVCMF